MKKINLIQARKLANTLQNIEYLETISDNLSSCRNPEYEFIVNGYAVDIDTDELKEFISSQIKSKRRDIEMEFGLDAW